MSMTDSRDSDPASIRELASHDVCTQGCDARTASRAARSSSTVERRHVRYGKALALKDVTLDVRKNHVTAFIGPSGCGKSTFIRCFNRMNDLIPSARVEGTSSTTARISTDRDVDPVEVRQRIGMVFQKPNPFPKSIYDNIAFGPRVLGMKDALDERVEQLSRGRRSGTR